MKQEKLRIPTLLLAVWMLIVAIPVTAFAELLQMTAEPMSDDTVYVLAEDQSKRTAFEKHYYCSDGTFVAVTYPEAVHYQNEQGEWVDVDLRLSDHNVSNTYESQSGDFKASFSKPSASGDDASVMSMGSTNASTPAVTLESGDYALSWSLTGTKPAGVSAGTYAVNGTSAGQTAILSASAQADVQVMGEFKTEEPAVSVQKVAVTDPDAFALPSASNQIIYENIFGEDQNVSVRYSVSQNRIEEDFLITAPTDMTSFSMQVEYADLTPVLNLDNSVDFVDNNGEMVYHVSTPYLADAAFAVSYDVNVTLTEQNGTCTITYTPDAEWMNDPARVYPIMLDPAVTTRDYNISIMDTYVESTTETCYLSDQYLRVHQNDGAQRFVLMQIATLPSIDSSMPIISASLGLAALTPLYTASSVDLKLEVIDAELNMLMVKYADVASATRTEVDQFTFTNTSTSISFDISSCITDLYNGTSSGYFAISLAEDFEFFVPPFYSSDDSVISLRPNMTITYGYTLPESLTANNAIQIQNVNSKGYLFHYGFTANDNDPLILSQGASSVLYQTFQLQLNTGNGAYRIKYLPYATAPDNFVSADISTNQVVFYSNASAANNIKQEWLIVPYGKTTFKIVLASDMRYVMTADLDNEAATETVSITQCTGAPTDAQLWTIYQDGQAVTNTIAPSAVSITTGTYYVNNRETGKFINRNATSSYVGTTSGLIEDIGESIEWQITKLPDGYYTIQSTQHPEKFLTALTVSATMSTHSGEITDAQKWQITGTSEQYYIRSVLNQNYLYATTEEQDPYPLGLQSGNLAPECKWRLVTPENYVEFVGNSLFNNLSLNIGSSETKAPSINNDDASWTLYTDFDYHISTSGECVEYNEVACKFTGKKTGTDTITAVHKITGRSATFTVTVYKPAVILIHGRIDNSFTLWGANTLVSVDPLNPEDKGNNHYNSSLNATTEGTFQALYTSHTTQEICSYVYNEELSIPAVFNGQYTGDVEDPYLEQHPEGGNLAYYLTQNGYTMNVDLFVFNYPNQDAVVHNANKLDAYLTNLATHIRETGSIQAKLSFFGMSAGISDTTPYNIDIVGHSMGGLVARYYIENIGKDENIRKLVTIDTPHWGSFLAGISLGPLHYLCDHDLMRNSKMFGGENDILLDACIQCGADSYVLTNELRYDADRSTQYYAIAGIDLPLSSLDQNDLGVNINPEYTTTTEISETIRNANSAINLIDIYMETDNIAGFLSQIGCVGTAVDGVIKKIDFDEIFVNIDTNGGNSASDHLHSKMAHRTIVMNKIVEMLNSES